jgi:hypothetical protein
LFRDHVAHMSGGSGARRTLPSFTARSQYCTGTGTFDAVTRACDATFAIGVASNGAPPVGTTFLMRAGVTASSHSTRSIATERRKCPPFRASAVW